MADHTSARRPYSIGPLAARAAPERLGGWRCPRRISIFLRMSFHRRAHTGRGSIPSDFGDIDSVVGNLCPGRPRPTPALLTGEECAQIRTERAGPHLPEAEPNRRSPARPPRTPRPRGTARARAHVPMPRPPRPYV